MKKLQLTLSLVIIGLLMSCGGTTERPKTAEELKVELEMQEKFSPHDYLSLDNLEMKTKSKKTKRGG